MIPTPHITSIEALPGRLEELLDKVGDARLDRPYGPGKWTVRQVVHHLAESHMNGFARLKWALAEDNPTLKPYDQDIWTVMGDGDLPIESSLQIIRGLHARWVAVLKALTPEQWKRRCRHPEKGEYTVESLTAAYANHGDKHLGHITQVEQHPQA